MAGWTGSAGLSKPSSCGLPAAGGTPRSGSQEPGDGFGCLLELHVGFGSTGFGRIDDAVSHVLIEESERTDCSALVIAET
jgi:hypothetical protein